MDLITTHVGADFDCMSSMLAARHLYPSPILVLPGSAEGPLRRYLERPLVAADIIPLRQVEREAISRYVLVDVCSLERLGPIGEWIRARPQTPVDYYDHHAETLPPIAGAHGVVRAVGATTTLLIGLLRERGVRIEAAEATALALGIYEDTGFLTFATTTPEDLEAVAWLRRQGADLRVISDYLRQGMTSDQIQIYHAMLQAARAHTLRGQEVTLAVVQAPRYVQDAAAAVHHLVDQERLRAFVALIAMEDQVLLIGRSRGGWLDMAAVAGRFGGGGHKAAASATLRGRGLAQIEAEVLAALEAVVPPAPLAADLMKPAGRPLPAARSVSQALAALNRRRQDLLPVGAGGRLLGVVTRRTLDQALHHGLGDAPVRDILHGELESVPPSAPLARLRDLLVEREMPAVAVVDEEGGLRGLVTRTDLFEHLAGSSPLYPATLGKERAPEEEEDLGERLSRALGEERQGLLRDIGREGAAAGTPAFLIGGVVRDLLLERPSADLDVVVEGDAAAVARRLAQVRGGEVRAHARFGTARWVLPRTLHVDFASARSEFYERPAALPQVEPGTLRQDLFRRDFTINTLALRLEPARFGRLVDLFGGRRDLKNGWVRVLHGLSFVEDPTRLLRAVRFSARLGFTITGETEALIRATARRGLLDLVSGERVWKELALILEGEHVLASLAHLERLGLLTAIHPALRLDAQARRRLERAEEVLHWYRLLYDTQKASPALVHLLALACPLRGTARRGLGERLALSPARRRTFEQAPALAAAAIRRLVGARSPQDSAVFLTCRRLPLETLLYAMALPSGEAARPYLSRYLTSLSRVKRDVTGEDLKRLGLLPGPEFGRILEEVLLAKLDGRAATRTEELALVRTLARAGRSGRSRRGAETGTGGGTRG